MLKYWIGTGTDSFHDDTKWSSASGGANDTTHASTGDTAIFDGNSGSCVINANVTVSKVQMESGYANTLTQSNTYTIACSSTFAFECDGGTFAGGDSLIDLEGDLRIDGGTFTATSGDIRIKTSNGQDFEYLSGTFNHNNGTVIMDGSNHFNTTNDSSNAFYNLVTESSATASWGGTCYIDGTLTLNTNGVGQVKSGNKHCRGDITGDGLPTNSTSETDRIIIDGAGNQAVDCDKLVNLEINKPSGNLDFNDDLTIQGGWFFVTMGTGTMDWNGYRCTSTGSSTHNTWNGGFFDKLTFNRGSTVAIGINTDFDVKQELVIEQLADINTGTINVQGDIIANDTNWDGSGSLNINGTGTQNYSGTGVMNFAMVTFNHTGTLNLNDNWNCNEPGADA